jgi:Sigma-70, region 4
MLIASGAAPHPFKVPLAQSFRPESRDPPQGLGLTEERHTQIYARDKHIGRTEFCRDAVCLPVIRVVERAAVPVIKTLPLQALKMVRPQSRRCRNAGSGFFLSLASRPAASRAVLSQTHNQNVNWVRRRVREGTAVGFDDEWPFPIAATDPTGGLSLRDLDRALIRIPEQQRQVIFLIGLEGISYQEAATILDVLIGTIRSRLSRGRQSLRTPMDWRDGTEAEISAGYLGEREIRGKQIAIITRGRRGRSGRRTQIISEATGGAACQRKNQGGPTGLKFDRQNVRSIVCPR